MRCRRATAFRTGGASFFKVGEVVVMSFLKYHGISQDEDEILVSSICSRHSFYIISSFACFTLLLLK